MSKVNTEHIVRLVLEVDLYKRPTSIPIITVSTKEDKDKFCVVAWADKHVAKFGPNLADFFMDGSMMGILVHCLSW